VRLDEAKAINLSLSVSWKPNKTANLLIGLR
jgi:hypothetical protein